MPDMIVLVPSRGRPANVGRLLEACAKTCRADTRLVLGFDEDDPHLEENAAVMAGVLGPSWSVAPRRGLAMWTNYLALMHGLDAPVLCSLGDDHVPQTDGWDAALIEAIEQIDGGWAYPDDSRRDDIAEAVAVSSKIIRGLGWMALPDLHHWCIDNAWTALARSVGRLEYLHHVKVPHYHPHSPVPAFRSPADRTYEEARWSYDMDKRHYLRWRDQGGLAAAAARVREILGMDPTEGEAIS